MGDLCGLLSPSPCVRIPHAPLYAHPPRTDLLSWPGLLGHIIHQALTVCSASSSLDCAFPGEGVLPNDPPSPHCRTEQGTVSALAGIDPELFKKWHQGKDGKCPFLLYGYFPNDTLPARWSLTGRTSTGWWQLLLVMGKMVFGIAKGGVSHSKRPISESLCFNFSCNALFILKFHRALKGQKTFVKKVNIDF